MTSQDPLVTGVLDRWAELELPGEPWPFMAIASLGRLQSLLSKALDNCLKPFGLSRTGYFVLTTLALLPRRRGRLSTLGRMTMLHPTTVKLTVDQLSAAGLVERQPHPRDRRSSYVVITDLGLQRAGAVNEALSTADEGFLGVLNGHDKDLFEALTPLRLAVGDVEL